MPAPHTIALALALSFAAAAPLGDHPVLPGIAIPEVTVSKSELAIKGTKLGVLAVGAIRLGAYEPDESGLRVDEVVAGPVELVEEIEVGTDGLEVDLPDRKPGRARRAKVPAGLEVDTGSAPPTLPKSGLNTGDDDDDDDKPVNTDELPANDYTNEDGTGYAEDEEGNDDDEPRDDMLGLTPKDSIKDDDADAVSDDGEGAGSALAPSLGLAAIAAVIALL